MTWNARFTVTEVDHGHIRARANVEDTVRSTRTPSTAVKVGDEITGYGHFVG